MFNINPFKKKQSVHEEQHEPYLPPDLERFRVREEETASPTTSFEVPEKERKFKAFAREMEPPRENIGWNMDNPSERNPAERNIPENRLMDNSNKLDMILQKLETIDLRLKVIEQKLERKPF